MTENGAPKKYKLVFLGEQSGMLSQISYFYKIFVICYGSWDCYVHIVFFVCCRCCESLKHLVRSRNSTVIETIF